MAVSLKHKYNTPKADGTDSTLVQPSHWNSEHDLLMATAKVLGRMTAGNGPVEELPLVVDPTGQSFRIPQGSTAQRPAAPQPGMMRFNTQTGTLEAYQNDAWGNFAEVAAIPLAQDVVLGRAHLAGPGPMQSLTRAQVQRLVFNVGMMLPSFAINPDPGFLFCYGQALNGSPGSIYADLFNVFGNRYGGSGAASFNLPDLRGRVLAGKDNMGGGARGLLTGAWGSVLGASGVAGAETHTLAAWEVPSHTHPVSIGSQSANHNHRGHFGAFYGVFGSGNTGWGSSDAASGVRDLYVDTEGQAHIHYVSSFGAAGNDYPHANLQPTMICNWQVYTGN